jgi:hypothetical protein
MDKSGKELVIISPLIKRLLKAVEMKTPSGLELIK